MKWNETIASQCRYGDVAERLFGHSDIIWEESRCDYQGEAEVFAALPDGRFCSYGWSYGSCSGCDEWEYRSLTDDQIYEEMVDGAVFFDNIDYARSYAIMREQTSLAEAFAAWENQQHA